MLNSEEKRELAEKKAQLNELAFANWGNPTWRSEMAAEITTTIYEGFEHENLLSLMSTVDSLGFDDRAFVKEVKGLRAFWVARGGYIEQSTLRADVLEIPRDTVGFHVSEFEDKIRTNFAETQQSLVDLGIQRLDAEINKRFLALLQAAIPNGNPSYVSGSGLSLTALNSAISAVKDTSKSGQIAIIGRATMTDQIMDKLANASGHPVGFLPESNEDMVRRGVLGTYRGARIITLTNHLDDNDTSFFPRNEMYVIGTDASRCALWGELNAKEWTDNSDWYWHYHARSDFGAVVHRPDRIRRIVDTAQTA